MQGLIKFIIILSTNFNLARIPALSLRRTLARVLFVICVSERPR
jgi:hypothetical protein